MLDPAGTKLAVLSCHVPNAVLATLAWPAASTVPAPEVGIDLV